jgi:hypothetical protein
MLDAFVTRAPSYGELGARLRERYGRTLDRVGLYGDAVKLTAADVSALRSALTSGTPRG